LSTCNCSGMQCIHRIKWPCRAAWTICRAAEGNNTWIASFMSKIFPYHISFSFLIIFLWHCFKDRQSGDDEAMALDETFCTAFDGDDTCVENTNFRT